MFEKLPKVRSQAVKRLLWLFQEFKNETELKVLQQKIRQKGFSKVTAYDYGHAILFLNSFLSKPKVEPQTENWRFKWQTFFETLKSLDPFFEAPLFDSLTNLLSIVCDSELSPEEKRRTINHELNVLHEFLCMIADENVRKAFS